MERKLTREEKRAVKKGKAYKSFWRFMFLGIVAFIVGCVLWLPLGFGVVSNLPDAVSALFFIFFMIAVMVCCAHIWNRGWRCPQCSCQLPRVSYGRGWFPKLVIRCPKCDYDLTDGNLEALDEHTKNTGNMIVPNSSDRYDLNDK